MEEIEEEIKSLLMKVKAENEKVGLKKSLTVSIYSLSVCHGVMGPDDMILVF